MEKITFGDAFKFLKTLIETGGMLQLDDDGTVLVTSTGQQMTYPYSDLAQPIRIYKTGQQTGNYVVCNPLEASLNPSQVVQWYYDSRMTELQVIVKVLMIKTIEMGTETDPDKEIPYEVSELISGIQSSLNRKMVDELGLIKNDDLIRMYYSRTNRTAQFQSSIFEDSYIEQLGAKVRKGTWPVLQDLLCRLLGTQDLVADYMHKATNLGMPMAEAKITLFVKAFVQLAPLLKSVLDIEVDVDTLVNGLTNLVEYHQLYKCVTSSISAVKTNRVSVPTAEVVGTTVETRKEEPDDKPSLAEAIRRKHRYDDDDDYDRRRPSRRYDDYDQDRRPRFRSERDDRDDYRRDRYDRYDRPGSRRDELSRLRW